MSTPWRAWNLAEGAGWQSPANGVALPCSSQRALRDLSMGECGSACDTNQMGQVMHT